MHAPIIQFITQCLNSEVKLRRNHETECEKEVHTRELQLGNACCLLWLLPVAPTARVGVAGREATGASRCGAAGCWRSRARRCPAALGSGRSRTGRRQPAGSARPPRGQTRLAPEGAAGVKGGGWRRGVWRRRARAVAGGSAAQPHERAQVGPWNWRRAACLKSKEWTRET